MDDGRRLAAERVFIASGARPAVPSVDGIQDVPYLTNESVLELERQPESLLILGGGYIGCELGHFFASLGTRVTVVDSTTHCLLNEDDEIGEAFTRAFGARVTLALNVRAVGAAREDGRVVLSVRAPDGDTRSLAGEALLVAAGRRPNTDDLELQRTGVEVDEQGWIRVDEHLRTTNPGIYAYGDCIGRAMFKHTSSYEGELAYRNAQGADRRVSYEANPHAVFGDPEIGSVGRTERACREEGLRYRAATVPYDGVAKGGILGSPRGLAKAIVEEGTGRILGFHVLGPHAATLIHEVVVAMCAGMTSEAIRDAIHVHPTMAELVEKVFGEL